MSFDNPFAVSSGSLGDRSGRDQDVSAVEVSARTIEILNQTRPWVQLMGVLLWIGTVLLALVSVVMVLLSFFGQVGPQGGPQGLFMVLAAVYIVMTLVYGALARALTTFASKINLLYVSEKTRDLEDALAAQKTFWKLVGILTLVGIVSYILLVALMVAGVVPMGNVRP